MPQRSDTILAMMCINRGKPFTRHVVCDGTPESGPYALKYYGFRWGQVRVVVSPNGFIILTINRPRLNLSLNAKAIRELIDVHLARARNELTLG